ncbi:MAG: hypothetical protein E6J90_50595 [Deltaproteobacteria bacterium]|nr:MAG: hypothetical protein E6J90_50595 [Deltaproteobacteria bacterium]
MGLSKRYRRSRGKFSALWRIVVRVAEPIARQAVAAGRDSAELARSLVDQLAGPGLQIAFVFADHRLDPAPLAGMHHRLSAPVVGCSAAGVVGPHETGAQPAAVGMGLYGDWARVGIGVATELSRDALRASHNAVHRAAIALGTTADALDPARHIAITVIHGRYDGEEAFCIGSAAAAPKIRFVGGCTATDHGGRTCVWVNGEVMSDAGVVIVLHSNQPFHAVSSAHLVPTEIKTVVTAVSGRVIEELDGRPAAPRLRQLVAGLGDRLDDQRPAYAFARYLDGVPYVRSLCRVVGDHLELACAVEAGHILRVMQAGDLIATTRRDLATAATRVGGTMAAFLVFSCLGRHLEAEARGIDHELAASYAAYPAAGFRTLSEQSGMLLLNHTLTGLAIGAPKP